MTNAQVYRRLQIIRAYAKDGDLATVKGQIDELMLELLKERVNEMKLAEKKLANKEIKDTTDDASEDASDTSDTKDTRSRWQREHGIYPAI